MKIENVALGMNELALGVALVAMLALLLGVTAKGRRYGVEIEVIRKHGVSKSGLANWLSRFVTGTQYRGYTHETMDTWKLVDDGSLNSRGVEIVSPPMYSEGHQLIHTICTKLKGLASADASCGVHLHTRILDENDGIDSVMYGGNLDKAVSLVGWMFRTAFAYNYFQPVIDNFMAPSRRSENNPSYCGSIDRTVMRAGSMNPNYNIQLDSFEGGLSAIKDEETRWYISRDIMSELRAGRYGNINFNALGKYGTIEFRQHGGTTNPNQINNWVELMQRLLLVCREDWTPASLRDPRQYTQTLGGFFEWLGLYKSPLHAFYTRRTKKFSGSLLAACTSCGSNHCDGDDFCPRTRTPTPYSYHDEMDEDEDYECEECGYDAEDCEC